MAWKKNKKKEVSPIPIPVEVPFFNPIFLASVRCALYLQININQAPLAHRQKYRSYTYISLSQTMVVVHNRNRAKNYTNILIEHVKNHLQRFIGLKTTRPDPLLMPLRLFPKYRKPNHKVSMFFTLLKIPPILHLLLLVSRVYSQREVENKNKNYWHIVKVPLPRSVICLNVHFLMRIQYMAQDSSSRTRSSVKPCKRGTSLPD